MRAPVSFLNRALPERYDAEGVGVTRRVWVHLLEVSISVLDQPVSVILDSFGKLGIPSLVRLKLIEVLISHHILVGEVKLRVLLL